MRKEYNVVIERDEAGFLVDSVPSCPGCHKQASFLDKLKKRIRKAIDQCLEDRQEKTEPLEFLGVKKILVGR